MKAVSVAQPVAAGGRPEGSIGMHPVTHAGRILAFFPGMSGGGEIFVVFLVVLLLFGSKRIPEVARGLARGLHEFRKATREIMDEVQSAASDTPPSPRTAARNSPAREIAETPPPPEMPETPEPPRSPAG